MADFHSGGFFEKTREISSGGAFDKPEPETFIVITSRKHSATVQAGGGAAKPVHPRKVALTVRAPVNESTTQSTPDQRQSMTGALASNSKVATGSAPFPSVRENLSPRARMC
jgi:hypothetical protein